MHRLLPYFETGDIGPRFVHAKNHAHPFGNLGAKLKTDHAELLGLAFITASKLSHRDLQEDILDKLKCLYPLPELALLSTVLVFSKLSEPTTQAEHDFGAYIIEHMVRSYPKLAKNCPEVLERVLRENSDVKTAVMMRLESETKEEKKGLQDESVPA